MWLLLAVGGLVGLIMLVTLLRAERSVANGTLAALTILAVGIALVASMRGGAPAVDQPAPAVTVVGAASAPAMACIDDLAGETVLAACEKILFGSPDMVAAAVSQAAERMTSLVAHGDVATADRAMTPDLQALRKSIERDRYGLVAYVLSVRDHCQPGQCAAYASLTDHNQIAANMVERTYEASIAKYAPGWNAPPASPGTASLMAPIQPTGRPTTIDFPTSASIPSVNIMTPEPPLAAAPASPKPTPPAKPATAAANPAPAAPKKPPAPRKPPAPAPVPLAPSSTAAPTSDQ